MADIEIMVPDSAITKNITYKCKCQTEGFKLSGKTGKVFWNVGLNDDVKAGDLLCEIEVQKRLFEILSPCDGAVNRIYVEDGDECECGTVLGTIKKRNSEILA